VGFGFEGLSGLGFVGVLAISLWFSSALLEPIVYIASVLRGTLSFLINNITCPKKKKESNNTQNFSLHNFLQNFLQQFMITDVV
jgi:hypothetical protein